MDERDYKAMNRELNPPLQQSNMEKTNKKSTWLVKDFDGEYIVVIAENWTCSSNGLCFFIGETKVAHFLRWSSYRKLNI